VQTVQKNSQARTARGVSPGRFAAKKWLVGGLEHDFYFSIYWEFHHPN